MNAPSWGLFANPLGSGAFVNAERSFSTPLTVGQSFSFQLGINWDSGSNNGTAGAKGFNLYTGNPGTGEIVNINNGGNSDITVNGENTGFGYGTNPMTWTVTYTSANQLTITANDRDGNGTFTKNVTVSAAPSSFRFYASNLQAGENANNRQPYFNNLQIAGDPAPAGNRTVTFNVNMSVQESLGNFNSSNGSVIVVGTFNDWNTGNGVTLSNTGNGVYSGNSSIFGAEGSTIEYKFVNMTPNAPNGGYEDGSNRNLTLGPIDQSQNVPVVYFSNVLPFRIVNFSVNMTEQIALGNFNATTGNVSVVGAFNGWNTGSGISLSNSGNGIYTGNGSISGLQGSSVAYKFYNSTPNAPNSGYEAGAERSLTLGAPGTPQTEPLATFRIPARPAITSAATQNGTVGSSLAYQITTSPSAVDWVTTFALTGNTTLPSGLTLNQDSGLINGIPTAAGNTTVQIQATNPGGAGNSTSLTFVIAQSSGGYSEWASSYSLTGNNSLPTADPDSDSFTNQQEYAFGTNPTQATAGLLSNTLSSGNFTIMFQTRPNLTYSVQNTDNLSTISFSDNATLTGLVGNSTDQNGVTPGYTRKQFTITPSGSKNFYRVNAN
jgi:hypothetical protein